MPRNPRINGATLALVAVFAALIAASTLWGGYPLGGGVPITLQTFAVLLAGAVLGAYRGAAAVLVYLILGTAGAPIFSGHKAGPGVWTGTSAGFLAAFVVAAFVTGWLAERLVARGRPSFSGFLGATVIGSFAVIGVIGWGYVALRAHLDFNATLGALTPFLPGDAIKAFLAAGVATAVSAAYPQILAREAGAGLPTTAAPITAAPTTAPSAADRPRASAAAN
jgi:biotin transport system substrate-specific component